MAVNTQKTGPFVSLMCSCCVKWSWHISIWSSEWIKRVLCGNGDSPCPHICPNSTHQLIHVPESPNSPHSSPTAHHQQPGHSCILQPDNMQTKRHIGCYLFLIIHGNGIVLIKHNVAVNWVHKYKSGFCSEAYQLWGQTLNVPVHFWFKNVMPDQIKG